MENLSRLKIFQKQKRKKKHMKELSFITQFKIEFLLLFTCCRKVLGKVPGVITLKTDTKFKRKLTCGLKNDLRNLLNFYASCRKPRNLHFGGLLLSKAYKDLDEKYRGAMSHDTEE